MISHTRTTIGTKPLAAIVAEFAASFPAYKENVPAGPGWVEATALTKALKISRWTFARRMREGIAAGKYECAIGSKMRAGGKASGTRYYRIKPKRPCAPC